MAQAADSPIGFRSTQKAPVWGISPFDDGSLAELHAWQTSPSGLVEAQIFALGSTIADLTRWAATPLGSRLLTADLADLESVQIELGQLIAQLHATRKVAA